MKSIIVDVDGTLADCEHRRHFVEKKPKDWKSFFAREHVLKDPAIMPVVHLVRCMAESGYHVIIVTGRQRSHKDMTIEWLRKNGIPFSSFFCRDEGDFREDYVVKSEILDHLISIGHDIHFTVDDRKQVVDMWRARGLVCFQVAEGNF